MNQNQTVRQDRRHSLSRARKDWERIPALPTARMAEELDRVLHAAFLDTQAKTHVHSGTLKASGRYGSNNRPGDSWLGRIAYGGTPGTEQALYEMALSEEHDFFRGQPAYDALYEAAITDGIDRELR